MKFNETNFHGLKIRVSSRLSCKAALYNSQLIASHASKMAMILADGFSLYLCIYRIHDASRLIGLG